MCSDDQAFSGVDGIVNELHVNQVQNTNFYGAGGIIQMGYICKCS
ncbi:hypothetical protein AAHH67_05135 [Niallia circulans]